METEAIPSPTPPSPVVRARAWLGFWLCAFALLPALKAWLACFHLHRLARPSPMPGSPRFWWLGGLYALEATLLTVQVWRKKPDCTDVPKIHTRPEHRRAALALVGLSAFVLVGITAGRRDAPPDWAGVLAGAAGLALLLFVLFRCAAAAQCPIQGEEPPPAAEVARLVVDETRTAPWVRPPRNVYRAGRSVREVVYQRPRVGSWVLVLFFGGLFLNGIYDSLMCLGRLPPPVSVMHVDHDSWKTAFILLSSVVVGGLSLLPLALTGPQEMHIHPAEGTYTLRTTKPLPPPFQEWVWQNFHDQGGIPWRVREYTGPCTDMAGTAIEELVQPRRTWYFLWLCWTIPDRPRMRLGMTRDLEDAYALQAQIADDLGIPALTDETG